MLHILTQIWCRVEHAHGHTHACTQTEMFPHRGCLMGRSWGNEGRFWSSGILSSPGHLSLFLLEEFYFFSSVVLLQDGPVCFYLPSTWTCTRCQQNVIYLRSHLQRASFAGSWWIVLRIYRILPTPKPACGHQRPFLGKYKGNYCYIWWL